MVGKLPTREETMREIVTTIFSFLFLSSSVFAADFTWYKRSDGKGVIVLRGTIAANDYERLYNGLYDISQNNHITFDAIRLDTGGGNLIAGFKLAMFIRKYNIATVVPANSMCASACFLIFAAGRERWADYTSKIGVHSVSINGEEDATTAQGTVIMTRYLSNLGVPKGIIGRLVTTKPNDMAWLDKNELDSMSVKYLSSNQPASGFSVSSEQQAQPTYQTGQESTPVDPKLEEWKQFVSWAISMSSSQNRGVAQQHKACNKDHCTVWVNYYERNGRYAEAIVIYRGGVPTQRLVCRRTYVDDDEKVCTDFFTERQIAYERGIFDNAWTPVR